MGPCGASIPDGVTCAKGAGWCEPGSYCGWERDVPGSRCLLLPKDCGAVGAACCPSNADSPHTSEQDKRNRMPFCKNGNTCFFFVGRADKPAGDIYTGNTGSYSCVKVEEDCGTGPGKPCCPVPYMVATNPVVKRQGCPGVPNGYCDYARETNLSPAGPLQPPRGARRGVCTANAPGCGQLGKACCWDTSGANSLSGSGTCGGGAGQPRGYCRNPFAASGNPYDKARPASFSELVCTKCPDNLDRETALKTNSEMYFMCTRSDR